MRRNETDGDSRDATPVPTVSGPPRGEPIHISEAVRAVVVRAGKSRLRLRVFGPLGRQGGGDENPGGD